MPRKTEETVTLDTAVTMQTESTLKTNLPDTAAVPITTLTKKAAPSSILTLTADAEIETPEIREDTIWHELQNAYRTRKVLTGSLGSIKKMEGGSTIAVVYYKEMRVVIPLAEMMINLVEDEAHNYGELIQRQNKILGNMLGCEIDFIIKGLDNASRRVVASRKDAMHKNVKSSISLMQMVIPAYAKTALYKQESLR